MTDSESYIPTLIRSNGAATGKVPVRVGRWLTSSSTSSVTISLEGGEREMPDEDSATGSGEGRDTLAGYERPFLDLYFLKPHSSNFVRYARIDAMNPYLDLSIS